MVGVKFAHNEVHMSIRRRTSTERRQATLKRRKYNRLVRHRANGRLTNKPRSANQRRAVSILKSKGFYRKIARLREQVELSDMPMLEVQALGHSQAFIALLVEQAAALGEGTDPAAFIKAYQAKDPWYTQTKVGLCAVALETYMVSECQELADLYIESLVEDGAESFYLIFSGKLPESAIEQVNKEVDFADFDILIEAGDQDPETEEISDVTVVEVTPNTESIDKDKLAQELEADEKAKEVYDYNLTHAGTVAEHYLAPKTDEDYDTIRKEGGLSEAALSALFNQEVADAAAFEGGALAWEDPHGVCWTLGGDKWLPLTESKEDVKKLLLAEADPKLHMQVANTITKQIGNRAFMMIGAKHLMGGMLTSWSQEGKTYPGLSFKVMKNAKGVTNIVIMLQPDDTYLIEFLKIRGMNVKVVHASEGVYGDGLHNTIEDNTGLRLSLGTMGESVLDETVLGSIKIMAKDNNGEVKLAVGKQPLRVSLGNLEDYSSFIRNVRMEYPEMEIVTNKALRVVEFPNLNVNESIAIDDLKKFAIPGKSLMFPDNNWWTISSRDLANDSITLKLSDFAKKDGAKDQEDKTMSWETFVKNAGSKWGINIGGRYYGPKQDKTKRAELRAANGVRKAPGTPDVTEATDDEDKTVSLGGVKGFKTKDVHISNVKVGDVILLSDGKTRTLSAKDIKRDPFMGTSILGDSYKSGKQPVKVVIIPQLKPGSKSDNSKMESVIELDEAGGALAAHMDGFKGLKPTNGLTPYMITFVVEGRKLSAVRYGKDKDAALALAKKAFTKEYDNKAKNFEILAQEDLTESVDKFITGKVYKRDSDNDNRRWVYVAGENPNNHHGGSLFAMSGGLKASQSHSYLDEDKHLWALSPNQTIKFEGQFANKHRERVIGYAKLYKNGPGNAELVKKLTANNESIDEGSLGDFDTIKQAVSHIDKLSKKSDEKYVIALRDKRYHVFPAGKPKTFDKADESEFTLADAQAMGKAAFKAGKKAAPALDTEFMKKCPKGKIGEAVPWLKAWTKGWHSANAAVTESGEGAGSNAELLTEGLKLKSVLSAFTKAGCKITEKDGRYTITKNGKEVQFRYDKRHDEVSTLHSRSPNTDVQRDYFEDTFFDTLKQALSYLNSPRYDGQKSESVKHDDKNPPAVNEAVSYDMYTPGKIYVRKGKSDKRFIYLAGRKYDDETETGTMHALSGSERGSVPSPRDNRSDVWVLASDQTLNFTGPEAAKLRKNAADSANIRSEHNPGQEKRIKEAPTVG